MNHSSIASQDNDVDQKDPSAKITKIEQICTDMNRVLVDWMKERNEENQIELQWKLIGAVCDRAMMISSIWISIYLAVYLL